MSEPAYVELRSSNAGRRVLRADLTIAATTLIWGATFLVVKDALRDSTPLSFNALRLTLATALLLVVYWRDARALFPLRLNGGVWRAGLLLGLFLGGAYAMQTDGLKYTSSSHSAFLTGVSVVLVPFMVWLLARARGLGVSRRLRLHHWLAAATALAGLYCLTFFAGPKQGGQVFGIGGPNLGDWLSLGCAAGFAAHIVGLGEFASRFNFRQLAVLQIGGAAVVNAVLAPVLEHPHVIWSERLVLTLVATAALATALTFTLQAWAQQYTPATHAAVLFALEPVFAWGIALLWGGERVTLASMVGAVLIVGANIGSEVGDLRGRPVP